jgi:hypothetical protein
MVTLSDSGQPAGWVRLKLHTFPSQLSFNFQFSKTVETFIKMYKRSNTPHKGQRLSGPANPNDDIPSKEGPSGSRYVEKLPRLSRRARLRSPSVHTDNSSGK